MNYLMELLNADTKILIPAIVSATVSLIVSYIFKKFEIRDKLQAEYEYEQRKKLRELIGRYHGRLLQAIKLLNSRHWNLYQNESNNWLHMNGEYSVGGYYFNSTVYRFLNVFALIKQFESEAIFLDKRIAK